MIIRFYGAQFTCQVCAAQTLLPGLADRAGQSFLKDPFGQDLSLPLSFIGMNFFQVDDLKHDANKQIMIENWSQVSFVHFYLKGRGIASPFFFFPILF